MVYGHTNWYSLYQEEGLKQKEKKKPQTQKN